MFIKQKKRVSRMLAVVLAIMLVTYHIPVGAILPVLAQEGDPAEPDVFTIQVTEDGVPVPDVSVSGHNANEEIMVTGTTNQDGVIAFPELTNAVFAENNLFEFQVEEKTFSLELTEGTTDDYRYELTTGEVTLLEPATKDPEPVPAKYQVAVTKTGAGVVKINDKDYSNPVEVKEGTDVTVAATPDTHYEIKSVKIAGETQSVTNKESFTKTITAIAADTTIEVEFVLKSYTITFQYNPDEGTIKDGADQTIDSKGGTVSVQHGSESSFTVNPATGYHIESIKIDEEYIPLPADVTETSKSYKHTFTSVADNHRVEVTFKINQYDVSARVIGYNGSIQLDRQTVDYNGDAVVMMLPNENFRVASLTVNGVSVDLENDAHFIENDDETFTYTVKNIVEDTRIDVVFERIPYLEGPWNTYVEIAPSRGSLVKSYSEGTNEIQVYSNDAELRISPIDPYRRVNLILAGEEYDWWNLYNIWSNQFSITESTNIQGFKVKTNKRKSEGEVDLDGNLLLVFDTQKPELAEPALSGKNEVTVEDSVWYSGAVTVTGTIDNVEQTYDGVQYSTDIDKVYYSKGNGQALEAAYDPAANRYTFDTVDEDFHGVYKVWAVDKAGNQSDVKNLDINIDKTVPTLADGEAVTFTQVHASPIEKVLHFLSFGTFFSEKIEVTVRVKDEAAGIKAFTLKTSDEKTIPQLEEGSFKREGLTAEATFSLDAAQFTGTFQVEVVDNVNNKREEPYLVTKDNSNIEADNSGVIMIEKTAPTAAIKVVKEDGVSSNGDEYNHDVTFEATVEDAESGVNTVEIKVNDTVYQAYDYSSLNEKQINPVIEPIGTEELEKSLDGSYRISVYVIDNAGNTREVEKTIYIDKTSPKITDFTFSTAGQNGEYENVEETAALKDSVELTEYGFFFKKPMRVTVTAEDPVVDYEYSSKVKAATIYLKDYESDIYYAVLEGGALKEIAESEIEGIAPVPTTGEITFNIPEAFKGQIFAKATDFVNNTGAYETPEGTVIENEKQHAKETHITFEKEKTTYKDNKNTELYAKNVNVNLTVTDTYSGLSVIEWSVIAPYDTAQNQSGRVKINKDKTYAEGSNTEGWQQTKTDLNLVTEMKKTLTVTHNSNDIVVKVKMTDRAGNTTEDKIHFSIDKTAPTIKVTYDNNASDAQNADYFKADRTATIVITERNFKQEDVTHKITNTDGAIPSLVGWKTAVNTADPDKTTHTATVKYTADGDYTFDISYKDNAANAAAPFAQHKFTLDKTKPVISVAYNNNAAANGNYYKASRTATISIKEHNFDTGRIKVTGTANDGGTPVAFPAVSGWSDSGDVHTASITYAADAKYSFDIEYTDMAGNVADDYAMDEFIIDQTAPVLAISGVADKSANNGDVIPVISYSDTNFNKNAVSIGLKGANRGAVSLAGSYADAANGQTYTFKNFEKTKENDDLYTLTATLTDFAGNVSTQTVNFSVNRFGSIYVFDETLKAIDGKYVKEETDVIVTETNVDSLKPETIKVKVTKNGTPSDLVEGKDYTVTETGGAGQWSQYNYVVKKELFAGDGRYTVALYSEDAAGNVNETIDETKAAEIAFGIDKTDPVIVPIDIENGEQYPVEEKPVTVSIKDNLVLEGAAFYLNGEKVEHRADGENFTFAIPSSNTKQHVKIVAVDAAGNELTKEVDDLLVSTNLIVRWYNNTPLFAGTLGGFGGLGIAATAFFVFRRQKKQQDVDDQQAIGG